MAEALLGHVQSYLAVGLVVAVLFALFGVPRVDAGARFDRGAPIGSVIFRVLLLPATTLLWPLVLVRSALLVRAARVAPPGSSPPPPENATGGGS